MIKAICIGWLTIFFLRCAELPQVPHAHATTRNSPRIVDIEFIGEFTGTSGEWHLLDYATGSQFYFDIRKYLNVDSIIFKASLRSERQSVRCVVDLYNLTDSASIDGSALFSRIIRIAFDSFR